MPKESPQSSGRLDRLFRRYIPERFLVSQHVFQAKVLWLYSLILGSIAILALLLLMLKEGDLQPRRVGTILLVSTMMLLPILMHFVQRFRIVAAYSFFVTTLVVFYVDFNNRSINGPSLILWLLPILIAGICFSIRQALYSVAFIFALVLLNVYFLNHGLLPESIVQPQNWQFAQILYLVITGVMLVVATKGLVQVSNRHFKSLGIELKTKEQTIQEIKQLKQLAESAAHSKTMFLATMSHELRTPLNSVIGNAQLLARSKLPDKHHNQINDIAVAGNLLLMLINDILDFSKLEQNELRLIEEPYDLAKQIKEIARMMESRLKKGVTLSVNIPQEQVVVLADQNRIAQVLMNLMSNAIKFTDKGQVSISLAIDENSRVIIEIQDSGIGIANDQIPYLFKEFSQVSNDSKRDMEGTGLGLAISHGIINQMNANIEVESVLDKGSIFRVVLIDRLQTIGLDDANDNLGQNKSLDISQIHILIVDDIAMNCTLLEDMLQDLGAKQFASVNSGAQAFSYLVENPDVDMILMDMRMPEMDGVEASMRIRAIGYTGTIIAVTANASAEDKERCLTGGMDDFISKPIGLAHLESTLLKYCE